LNAKAAAANLFIYAPIDYIKSGTSLFKTIKNTPATIYNSYYLTSNEIAQYVGSLYGDNPIGKWATNFAKKHENLLIGAEDRQLMSDVAHTLFKKGIASSSIIHAMGQQFKFMDKVMFMQEYTEKMARITSSVGYLPELMDQFKWNEGVVKKSFQEMGLSGKELTEALANARGNFVDNLATLAYYRANQSQGLYSKFYLQGWEYALSKSGVGNALMTLIKPFISSLGHSWMNLKGTIVGDLGPGGKFAKHARPFGMLMGSLVYGLTVGGVAGMAIVVDAMKTFGYIYDKIWGQPAGKSGFQPKTFDLMVKKGIKNAAKAMGCNPAQVEAVIKVYGKGILALYNVNLGTDESLLQTIGGPAAITTAKKMIEAINPAIINEKGWEDYIDGLVRTIIQPTSMTKLFEGVNQWQFGESTSPRPLPWWKSDITTMTGKEYGFGDMLKYAFFGKSGDNARYNDSKFATISTIDPTTDRGKIELGNKLLTFESVQLLGTDITSKTKDRIVREIINDDIFKQSVPIILDEIETQLEKYKPQIDYSTKKIEDFFEKSKVNIAKSKQLFPGQKDIFDKELATAKGNVESYYVGKATADAINKVGIKTKNKKYAVMFKKGKNVPYGTQPKDEGYYHAIHSVLENLEKAGINAAKPR
jgi:hypothetical protein